jgi:hypothetical protein
MNKKIKLADVMYFYRKMRGIDPAGAHRWLESLKVSRSVQRGIERSA